jgi:SAM-dependent methyltransferase
MIVVLRAPPLTPLAAAVLHVPVPERVLVIECGDGEPALFLAREFPAARIRGVDSSAARVRAAASRVGLDPEGRVAFKRGGPGSLPYPDGFFDLVAQVDGRPAPAEIARVLRPGGHLVLAHQARRRFFPRSGERLLRRRLARHAISVTRAEPAGDGNFLVGCLDRRG